MGLKLYLDPIEETTFQVRNCQFASFRMAAQTSLQPSSSEQTSEAFKLRPVTGLMAGLVDPQLRASNEGLLRPRVPRARGINQVGWKI